MSAEVTLHESASRSHIAASPSPDLPPSELRRIDRLRRMIFDPTVGSVHDCFYRTVVEGSLDMVTVVDGNGTVIYTSPSCERQLGYTPEELVGRSLFDCIHPDDERRVRDMLADAAATGFPSPPIEHRLRHKNGTWRTLETVGRFRSNLPTGVLGIVHSRDVTARKLLEAQLRQGQKMQAVGLMTGAIAHDFNNLLCVIVGYADLLAIDSSPAVRELTAEMRQAIDRASDLTRQLLGFARPASGDQPASCDANRAIADLRSIVDRLLGDDIDLLMTLDATRSHVPVARVALDQVLINLIVNARDAMPRGGHLTITTRNATLRRPGDGAGAPIECVVLQVTDTGVGMSDAVKTRIFEPFFSTNAQGKGTGLGLQTVQRVVQQAGGWIRVTSAPNQGATFTLALPCCTEGEDAS